MHVIHSTPYRHECYACRNNVDSNHQERVPTSCRTGFSEEAESRSPSTTEQPCFSDRISLFRGIISSSAKCQGKHDVSAYSRTQVS